MSEYKINRMNQQHQEIINRLFAWDVGQQGQDTYRNDRHRSERD